MVELLKERPENMDSMDLGEHQESVRRDFESLIEMFNQNFYNLDAEKLEQLRIKVSDLKDLLKPRVKKY